MQCGTRLGGIVGREILHILHCLLVRDCHTLLQTELDEVNKMNRKMKIHFLTFTMLSLCNANDFKQISQVQNKNYTLLLS